VLQDDDLQRSAAADAAMAALLAEEEAERSAPETAAGICINSIIQRSARTRRVRAAARARSVRQPRRMMRGDGAAGCRHDDAQLPSALPAPPLRRRRRAAAKKAVHHRASPSSHTQHSQRSQLTKPRNDGRMLLDGRCKTPHNSARNWLSFSL
jgi:hypothetical protein